MVLAVAVAILGVVLAHRFYIANPRLPAVAAARFPVLYRRLVDLLGVDAFYETPRSSLRSGVRRARARPARRHEDHRRFVNGCASVARRMARAVAIVQDGSIQNYLTWMVLGTLLLLLTLLA